MSTPPSVPPKTPPVLPVQPQAGKPTWLCQFSVTCDLPNTMEIHDMEGAIAFAVAQYLAGAGLPGNVSVQLVATAGGQTMMTHGGPIVPSLPVDITQPPPKGPGAPV